MFKRWVVYLASVVGGAAAGRRPTAHPCLGVDHAPACRRLTSLTDYQPKLPCVLSPRAVLGEFGEDGRS